MGRIQENKDQNTSPSKAHSTTSRADGQNPGEQGSKPRGFDVTGWGVCCRWAAYRRTMIETFVKVLSAVGSVRNDGQNPGEQGSKHLAVQGAQHDQPRRWAESRRTRIETPGLRRDRLGRVLPM